MAKTSHAEEKNVIKNEMGLGYGSAQIASASLARFSGSPYFRTNSLYVSSSPTSFAIAIISNIIAFALSLHTPSGISVVFIHPFI
jgi:hypothetical protein